MTEDQICERGLMPKPLSRNALLTVAVAGLAAGVTVLIYRDWFLPNPQNIDEWVYLGVALDYWGTPETTNYKVSRLPWVLLLSAFLQMGNAEISFIFLQWILLSVSLFAIGITIQHFYSGTDVHPIGLLFMVVSSAYFAIASLGGPGYHTALSNPLAGLLVAASLPIWRKVDLPAVRHFVMYGALLGLAGHTNPHIAFLIPGFATALVWRFRGRLGFPVVVWIASGVALVTVFFGIISLLNGNAFFFWSLGLRTAIDASTNLGAWYQPIESAWFADSGFYYLVVPTIAFGMAILSLLVQRSRPQECPSLGIFGVFMLVNGAVWILLHQSGILMLAPNYYAATLQVPSLMYIAAVVAHPVLRTSTRRQECSVRPKFTAWKTWGSVLGALLVVHTAVIFGHFPLRALVVTPEVVWVVVAIICALVLLLQSPKYARSSAITVAIISFLIVSAIAPTSWRWSHLSECAHLNQGTIAGAIRLRSLLLADDSSQILVVVSSSTYRDFAAYRAAYSILESRFEACSNFYPSAFPVNAFFTIHDYRYPVEYVAPRSDSRWGSDQGRVVEWLEANGHSNVAIVAPTLNEVRHLAQELDFRFRSIDVEVVNTNHRQAYVYVLR